MSLRKQKQGFVYELCPILKKWTIWQEILSGLKLSIYNKSADLSR